MWRIRLLLLRLVNTFRRGRAEQQLSREIEAHLAILEEDYRKRGLSPEAARLAARREFGGVEQAKEVQRDARGLRWLADAWRDIHYAVRTLGRAPGFTAVAVITLGLGIGAATVIYSVVRNVVLDPFPYAHPDRLVDVVIRDAAGGLFRGALPPGEFLDYMEQSDVFEDVAGANGQSMHLVSAAGAERVAVILVTPNTFTFLGVAPLIGRTFGAADAAPDAPQVAVLNHRTWLTRFGGDREMVGRSITLNGVPRTIVGIMPPRFEWHVGDFWIPSPLSRISMPADQPTTRWFQARLRRGVTIEAAEAQMNVIARRRATAFPTDYPEKGRVQVITIIDWVVGRFRQTLYTLFAAVGLLVVIACCNVANMLLARATARERELTLRTALGASRGRIIRQLLMESAVLAVGGTAVGVALAHGGIKALAGLMPRSGVAWEVQLRLDQPVLLFALATAALATLAFGLFPAFTSTRRDLVRAINSGGRLGSAGPGQSRMRAGLVIAEVALSVILLLGAGLLMRTFVSLVGVDLGFNPRNLFTANVSFPAGQAPSGGAKQQFYANALNRIRTIPGVQAASVSSSVPPFGGSRTALLIPGIALPANSSTNLYFCSEEFVATLGLRLVAGRMLSANDVASARRVALINETLATRFFGEPRPLGRTIQLPRLAAPPVAVADPSFEVIGIVQDVRNQGIMDAAFPQAYLPFTVPPVANFNLIVRTSGEPMAIAEPVRRELRALDSRAAFSEPISVETQLVAVFHARPRFNALMLGIFAGTGLVLVSLGIYGVVAYTVSQQTRQIAIRMALGGERRHVLRMVLRGGLTPVAIGLVAGVAAGLLTNRLLERAAALWRVTPYDPVTIGTTVALVVGIGICACCVPAWRAMRVEPVVALRQE
jgi:putative ABC transport system permease protein